ncbi:MULTISPECIES: DNA polymerase III subunit epsilon [Pseudoalteromonas]|uniref:DNA polymerase III subunit epsilon n=1 Tax=Pseudoalteromonas ruthenica TaxID=151081 RepID=A0A0F4PIF0_9GAMM|nr:MULTISPECIES: DNA polymerase III subunit epsilon [Pseudoalteromonas]KJY95295.1 DNA polymerase III subunit epsilon [Pseudoalteromonas ruthenica]KJY96113.1 DNA polymerase III subunit epsilon [Pseudoalteromonas ruthenica]MCF2861242.1 DNA polymerase III subunit epsilon [Pseudoalteromonas sp. CNAT2-18]MCG7545153.1 DNA polymerase III subunit epsilon [Pseudoalteromonas sp. MM17-2]MCG7557719.1 DNA polymerase III subunit epsilon [Pseudoalteromonas sp. CNAT2-18.1]|tara:strand:- start:1535 stop:2248 length:714 start_codon:yes stop_codon:yes gene_type:complete
MAQRQIVLDTETTGISPKEGHRIIEIGCVELINRRLTGNNFHVYINPQRDIEDEAIDVHGITNEFLQDKPLYHQIADEFLDYIRGAELVIHNAPFDVGFMDHEFAMLNRGYPNTEQVCQVLDTLTMAREMHPGQKNNLDALCRRYDIDNAKRTLHGALLDSEILADVYLAMTGGQKKLNLAQHNEQQNQGDDGDIIRLNPDRPALTVLRADEQELAAHEQRLDLVEKEGGHCLWRTQ